MYRCHFLYNIDRFKSSERADFLLNILLLEIISQ